jgi:hypothetical protein
MKSETLYFGRDYVTIESNAEGGVRVTSSLTDVPRDSQTFAAVDGLLALTLELWNQGFTLESLRPSIAKSAEYIYNNYD